MFSVACKRSLIVQPQAKNSLPRIVSYHLTMSSLVPEFFAGGLRTRVAAGTKEEVKMLFLKSHKVFPAVSAAEGAGAYFEDLEIFITLSDTRRSEMV